MSFPTGSGTIFVQVLAFCACAALGSFAGCASPATPAASQAAEKPAAAAPAAKTCPDPVGSNGTVVISGTGFSPGKVSLTMPVLGGMEVATPTADASGAWSAELPLMANTPDGAYEIVCTDSTGAKVSAIINVKAGSPETCTAAAATPAAAASPAATATAAATPAATPKTGGFLPIEWIPYAGAMLAAAGVALRRFTR